MKTHYRCTLTSGMMFSLSSLCFFIIAGCTSKYDYIYQITKENKEELQKVLDYYKKETIKYKAADFLIANMVHGYPYTTIMDEYKYSIMSCTITKGIQDSL